ncbi:hypothetical protein [Haladaptatus sp. DFWS20]|uniref:hypothetical protein n=1 Tax=Haladaptatus sp. DFWS20 TaxID=3403467 RepID=UPI003EBBA939
MTKQTEEVLDQTTNAVEVVSHLDLGLYVQHDPFADWHDAKPFEPMLRVVQLDELEDASNTAMHRTLDSNRTVARVFEIE